MKITRKSPVTGNIHTLDLPVTNAQLAAWARGTKTKEAFPNLSADEREFIRNGITAKEWAEKFFVGKFRRNKKGTCYVGWLDMDALTAYQEAGCINCRLLPNSDKDSLDYVKVVCDRMSD